jgi:hypothetical protein
MIDIEAIKVGLFDRLDALVAALPLPEAMPGHRSSRELRFGRKGSLVIYGHGHRRAGRFRDFEGGASGDLIDLVAQALRAAGGDPLGRRVLRPVARGTRPSGSGPRDRG